MQILPPCSGKLLQERLRLSWRGCVCADSSARVWGWERSWKGPRSGSGVCLVLGVTGLAAQGCETSTVARPSWWHLPPPRHCHLSVSCYSHISAVPGSAPSWNQLWLPPAAAPLRCSHQTQHVFESLSIFNENFCVSDFLGLDTSGFWWLLGPAMVPVPVSPGWAGEAVWALQRILAHPNPWQHIPVPAVPAVPSQAAAPAVTWRDPCSHGCSSLAGWERDTWKTPTG